ncbi:phosphatase PAP2 family protein [Actinoplanes flavus]|uniref:Phosphatase PAP2 family protein n=1 Tax=Actinoplanes flavus TaxID=2820290 RepID=A0ABS3URA9_9ACTN|nr:phosphatase PAP2 family protein [Actinoplanes flavus]MBO3741314.1 phosphatase PAP2 family protein [Actinoplanes flavus]
MTDMTTRRRLVAPLVVGVLAALGTLATYHVFVRTISGQWLDTAAMLGTDVEHPRLAQILTRVLNGTTLAGLVLVCLVVVAVGVVRRRPGLAVAAAVLVLGANGTTQFLKDVLTRPPIDRLEFANSLPSGHTTAAASVAFAVVLVLPEAVRATAALCGAGYTAAIAIATVWSQWHRPSDAVAAMFVVLGWGALVVLGVRLTSRDRTAATGRPTPLGVLPLAVTGLVTAPAAALGFLVAKASEPMTTTPEPSRIAVASGAAGVAAVVAGAFLVWLWLATDGVRGQEVRRKVASARSVAVETGSIRST